MADGAVAEQRAARERALDALGSPARRAMLSLLRDGEQTVRQLTDQLPVTQSAVSQHLKVLLDARLVDVRAEGTRRLYRIDPDGLGAARAWVDDFWDTALDAFARHVDRRAAPTIPTEDTP